MKILNLTPHAVRVIPADGSPETVIPPSGQVARVAASFSPIAGEFAPGTQVPILLPVYGRLVGLPVTPGDFIVSRMVGDFVSVQEIPGRRFYVPADLVRDPSGAVIGCRGLEVL